MNTLHKFLLFVLFIIIVPVPLFYAVNDYGTAPKLTIVICSAISFLVLNAFIHQTLHGEINKYVCSALGMIFGIAASALTLAYYLFFPFIFAIIQIPLYLISSPPANSTSTSGIGHTVYIVACITFFVGAFGLIFYGMLFGQHKPSPVDPDKTEENSPADAKVDTHKKRHHGANVSIINVFFRADLITGLVAIFLLGYMGFKEGEPFHGIVIDQDGQPLVGAEIDYSLSRGYLSKGSPTPDVQTDSRGYFTIKDMGETVRLREINHKEINNDEVFFPGVEGDSKGGGYVSIEDTSIYTKEYPYIISVWRETEFEKIYRGTLGVVLPINGDIVTLVYDKVIVGRVRYGLEDYPGEQPEGILMMSCQRGPYVESKIGDMEITIESINGGIQPTMDLYSNNAPTGDYLAKVTISLKGDDYDNARDYNQELNKERKYYFYSHNKEIYGRLRVYDIEPYDDDEEWRELCSTSISYKFNKNGSKNLAIPQAEYTGRKFY